MQAYKDKHGTKCNMCHKPGYHIAYRENGNHITCPYCSFTTEPKLCEGFEVKDKDENIIEYNGQVYYCVKCTNLFAIGCKHGINGCMHDIFNTIIFTAYDEGGVFTDEPLKFDTLNHFLTTISKYTLHGQCSCALDTQEENIECSAAIYRGKIKNGLTNYSLVDLFEDKHNFNTDTLYNLCLSCNSIQAKSKLVTDFVAYCINRADIQYELCMDENEENIVLELESTCEEFGRTIEFTRMHTFYTKVEPYTKCIPLTFYPIKIDDIEEEQMEENDENEENKTEQLYQKMQARIENKMKHYVESMNCDALDESDVDNYIENNTNNNANNNDRDSAVADILKDILIDKD